MANGAKRVITTNPHGQPSQGQPSEESPTPDPNSQGGQPQGTPDTTQTPDPATSSGTPEESGVAVVEPTPPQFRNPRLAGRSVAEAEHLYGLAEQTVQQQGQRLSEQERRIRELETQVSGGQTPGPEKVSSQEFFADPAAHIQDMLNKTVEPLRQEVADAKAMATAPSVREALRREYQDWDIVEPYVNMMLQQAGQPDSSDPNLLRSLYFTAKGMAVHQGVDLSQPAPSAPPTPAAPGTPAGVGVNPTQPAMAPPQHRASSPPPPPRSEQAAGPSRELTENEKRFARENKMTDEEFLYWQELDEAEVPVSKYGKEGNGNG